MAEVFDTLLLLALPASGKSEVRTYLTARDPARFHMGPTVQLDDYPYVHLQIRADEELESMGLPRAFHDGDGGPFRDPHEWGALVHLLDEDYRELRQGGPELPPAHKAALRLFERFDNASHVAGGKPKFRRMDPEVRGELAVALEDEAMQLFQDKAAAVPDSLEGKTIVIEFARGGPEGALPLPAGYGYRGSLPFFSDDVLRRAAVLYIWVTPEESRRKNRARARPDGQGSILFHGTPEVVMRREYGQDDMDWLLGQSDVPDTIRIDREGGAAVHLPTARFDNRVDKTSFLREPPEAWSEADVQAIHGGLEEACDRLWARYAALRKG
jgi:hypothetical protein